MGISFLDGCPLSFAPSRPLRTNPIYQCQCGELLSSRLSVTSFVPSRPLLNIRCFRVASSLTAARQGARVLPNDMFDGSMTSFLRHRSSSNISAHFRHLINVAGIVVGEVELVQIVVPRVKLESLGVQQVLIVRLDADSPPSPLRYAPQDR